MTFNIICASHNEDIYKKNLAASLFLKRLPVNNIKIVKGHKNIPQAYNIAAKFLNKLDYNIYSHHDLFMPEDFEDTLIYSIQDLNDFDPNWGVCGVAGATMKDGKRIFYEHLNDRGNEYTVVKLPKEVQTLDEVLLITKGDFTFDEQFDLHFYGADICLQAISKGRKNYVIDAYVHHNSGLPLGYRSESFYECERKFKAKWSDDYGPIATTCSIIKN